MRQKLEVFRQKDSGIQKIWKTQHNYFWQNFLPESNSSKTFWQLGCQVATLFPPLVPEEESSEEDIPRLNEETVAGVTKVGEPEGEN